MSDTYVSDTYELHLGVIPMSDTYVSDTYELHL